MDAGPLPAGGLPASMTDHVPPTASEDVVALVQEHYGFRPQVQRLGSERDEIFRLTRPAGQDCILRLAHPADDPGVLHMQTAALETVRMSDSWLPVPRLIRTRDRAAELFVQVGPAPPRHARLTTCLPGQPLSAVPHTPHQSRVVGTVLARLALALREFVHPAASHRSVWDIQHAAAVLPLVPEGGAPAEAASTARWDLVRRGLEHFECTTRPALGALRQQTVHGDLNPHNILVDPADPERISGIIDFGDMVRTQLVNDLAVAASNHVDDADDLAAVAGMVQAYHAVLPLRVEEVELLHDLMVARLCMNVTISEWRARRQPAHRDHILKNTGRAWRGLQRLAALRPGVAPSILLRACGMRPHLTQTTTP